MMFALAIVALFFLPFVDSKAHTVYHYYKKIFNWTDEDYNLMAYAVYSFGKEAPHYIAYNPKLTRKMDSAYDVWNHLSPESKKFVQNFNKLLFDERTVEGKCNFSKLKPFVESLSKKARDELCKVYKGFGEFLKDFGKKSEGGEGIRKRKQ
ncbi:unnamed protein product [Cylicocyclus nassatus]|uniref:Uncharacterized protein n=1 Tax=Cylicocyclus nassatus TaxID=53992 RepID=A0AA36GSS9_CYLNA|nr:unnamed protein product [Cylicocyclus nassatus]